MAELSPLVALGLRGVGSGASLAYADDGELLYACGRSVVFVDDTGAQHVVSGTPGAAAITALAVAPNKK